MKKVFKNSISIVLSGGGPDITKIIADIAQEGVFEGKSVAYVSIAAEKDARLFSLIKEGFQDLEQLFHSFGAARIHLIDSLNADEMYNHEIIIFSGGDTSHLLSFLQNNDFKRKFYSSNKIRTLIGISAGAIALAAQGVGTFNRLVAK